MKRLLGVKINWSETDKVNIHIVNIVDAVHMNKTYTYI